VSVCSLFEAISHFNDILSHALYGPGPHNSSVEIKLLVCFGVALHLAFRSILYYAFLMVPSNKSSIEANLVKTGVSQWIERHKRNTQYV